MIAATLNRLRVVQSHIVHAVANRYRERLGSLLHGVETRNERFWEWRRYRLQSLPSDGEMAAILRRNGWPGFYAYVFKQRRGDFGRRCFVPGDRDGTVRTLRERFPEEAERIVAQADRLLRGEFDLLGSGPVDMRRGKADPGHKIDWDRDPISGERYPAVFSQWRWNPFKMRRGNADVKGPWELTRCQHFPLLGQAYWLTGDERYAECYARTIEDFIRRNRPGIGVHWACTMDVALRVVSWLAGLSYFQGSRALNLRWWRRFLKSLVQHGRHITNNLEFGTLDGRIIVSNHGLANLFGLYWLALNFPGLDAGCVWRGLAESGLEQQVRLQLLDDGGGFESSLPYHRLVTEMFLSAYALSRHHGLPFSDQYRERVVKALRFLKALRQDGGRVPQIGDADNGRAHIFSDYGKWELEQENMDHLLVAGAAVLGCPELTDGIAPARHIEALLWGHAATGQPAPAPATAESTAILFPDAGIAVLRQAANYAVITNSVCGTFGIGNHKHNDQLAIEWAIGAQPIFVDGGSYTYTQDPAARNWFRATAQHNTLQIDGEEQNGTDPAALFRLVQQGEPEWTEPCRDQAGNLGIRARSTAYCRLAGAPLHERRIMLGTNGVLVIDDLVDNAEGHALRWSFLVHPGVTAELADNRILLRHDHGAAMIEAYPDVTWKLEPAWYSRGYGVRQATVALVAEARSLPRMTFAATATAPMREAGSRASWAERTTQFWQPADLRKPT